MICRQHGFEDPRPRSGLYPIAAETLLDASEFNAIGSFLEERGTKSAKFAYALELADLLDRYNNGEFCGDFAD